MDVEDYHPLPELPDGGVNQPGERDYRKKYFQQLFRLQGELVKLQDWVGATRHQGQGDNAGAQPHSRGALVGGAGGRQEARAAQLHRSPAELVPDIY
jgi:hypothetical protein